MISPMSCPSDPQTFSLWLRHEIEHSASVAPDIGAYLEAAFGHSDLHLILRSAESSDIDTLTDFIFFPDDALRNRFEATWGEADFSESDLEAVRNHLVECPPRAHIQMAPGGPTIHLAMPAFAAGSLLQRLNLTWRPCPRLIPILQAMEVPRRVMVRMHLRGAHLAWHPDQIELLTLYLTRMPAEPGAGTEMLTFLLSLLAQLNPGDSPERFLIARKRFFHQCWSRADEFERRRQTANMEILMLQGERAAHGDPHHWREQMAQVDRLSTILFQRIEVIPSPIEEHLALTPEGFARDVE